MGRMSYIWGDDAEDFKPERWLNDNGIFQPQSPFKFVAFHVSVDVYVGPILENEYTKLSLGISK